jgi:diguanylate cyclase (GGDEF)-like protein
MMNSQTKATTVILLYDKDCKENFIGETLSQIFDITETVTAQQMIDLLSQLPSQPRMIILDLIHCREQGLAFLEMRKNNSLAKEVPVLSMTLSDDLEMVLKSFALGSNDYFSLPIAPEVFMNRIFEFLRKKENSLEEAENPIQENLLFDESENGIAMFSYTPGCLKPIYANEKVVKKNHFSSTESFCSQIPNALALLSKTMRLQFEQKIEKAIATRGSFTFTLESLFARFQMSWIPYPNLPDPVLLLVAVNSCEQDAKQRALVARLEFDSLTGLYNREAFYKKAENLISENPKTTYLYIRWNVIKFKMINDMFGNSKGDTVLKQLAKGFLEWIDDRGVCARFYSDQFAFFLPKKNFDADKFVQFSLFLLQEANSSLNLKMSFGIYQLSDKPLSIEKINERAKLAVRSIQEGDTKPYCYYDEAMRNKVLSAQRVMDSFEGALSTKQFVIYLQPVYNVNENRFVSAEALVRWITPDHGVVSPFEFIPLLEENGLILKLDLYVLEQVCILQRSLIEQGKNPIPISSNLSRVDFFNPELSGEIIAIVDRYDLAHSLIRLEITETAYMDNPQQLLQTIAVLQKQGFEILMDDFGSGYSSLNILQDVPIDILKIDQLFTSEIGTSNKTETILQNIVNMAQGINLMIIAEGVETKEQATFFKSIGCDTLQGYYFSKPKPENEYRLLLDHNLPSQGKKSQPKQKLSNSVDTLFITRYGKLLQTIFLTILELNFTKDTYKTLYANSSFTTLPFGTAGSLSEVENKFKEKLIHPDDRISYTEENSFCAKSSGECQGSFRTSEFRMVNRNGFYTPVFRIALRSDTPNGDCVYYSFLAHKENKALASSLLESIKDLENQKMLELQCMSNLLEG